MIPTKLVDVFHRARGGGELAVIEGVQALKHALRFQAQILHIVTADKRQLTLLLEELAPDTASHIDNFITEVSEQIFQQISPKNHRTKVVTLAKQQEYRIEDIDPHKPIVFLENPKDLENVGAVIRVAAAAGIGAVVSSGEADIWHPAVIRGGAGLQYAVPVFNGNIEVLASKRPLIALDPTGEDIRKVGVTGNAVLVFGTERYGISKEMLARADKIVRLPMQEGVSSLNLATSVAATLYGSKAVLP